MRLRRPHLFFCLLVLAAAITLACGSSPHLLQSVAVVPATAEAQNFPNGLVQFTATGIFNTAPTPVTPLQVTWRTCGQTGIAVTATGMAHCTGAAGTFSVSAQSGNPSNGTCALSPSCDFKGSTCSGIYGSAQLTCP